MRLHLRSAVVLLLSFPVYSQTVNRKSTHIQNPSFGSSSRFLIIEDSVIESEPEEETAILPVQEEKNEKPVHKNFSPASSKFYSSEKIENSKSQNIQEFLQEQGLLVMTTGGTGSKSELSFKGYTSFCIKVYINGVLANNSTTGEFDWNSIDVNSIESIEISEVPELDEAEFAGCIIRITTKFSKDHAMIEVASGGYENSIFDSIKCRTHFSQGFGNFSYNAGAQIDHSKNEFERPALFGTNKDNFSTEAVLNYGWNVDLAKNARLYGNNVFSYNRLKAFGTGPDYDTGIEEDVTSRNNVNFSFSNENIKSDTAFSYNLGNVRYVTSYAYNQITDTNFNRIALTERFFGFCDLTAGVVYEWLPSDTNSNRLQWNAGAGKKFEFGEFSIEPQVIGLFWHNNQSGARVLPRLNMAWQGVNLSLYRSCVLPTFNQLYWPDTGYAKGNPDLKPEEGWAAFVGFKRDDFPVWANYTFSYYGNKIRWINGATPSNIGDAFYNVVTVGGEAKFLDNHLVITGEGTYTSARLCDTGKQIMWVPEWQAHAGISGYYGAFRGSIDYSFTSYRYTSNDNVFYLPAYHMLDATVSFKPVSELELYAKGTNLLDQRVPYYDNYYMPSRKITVGVKLEK